MLSSATRKPTLNARAVVENRVEEMDKQPRERAVEALARAGLRRCSYTAIRDVSCEMRSGVLWLRGRVPSYYMKQIAQTVVRHVLEELEDAVDINNELDVERNGYPRG